MYKYDFITCAHVRFPWWPWLSAYWPFWNEINAFGKSASLSLDRGATLSLALALSPNHHILLSDLMLFNAYVLHDGKLHHLSLDFSRGSPWKRCQAQALWRHGSRQKHRRRTGWHGKLYWPLRHFTEKSFSQREKIVKNVWRKHVVIIWSDACKDIRTRFLRMHDFYTWN